MKMMMRILRYVIYTSTTCMYRISGLGEGLKPSGLLNITFQVLSLLKSQRYCFVTIITSVDMAAFSFFFSFSDRDTVLIGAVDRNVDSLVIQQVPQEGCPSTHTG